MPAIDPTIPTATPDPEIMSIDFGDGLGGESVQDASLATPESSANAQKKSAAPANIHFFTLPKADTAIATEDWLITYADMVTLLLTMFVVLVLSASFDKASGQPAGSVLRGVLQAITELRVDSPYEESLTLEPGKQEGEQVAVIPQGTSLTIVKDEDFDLIEQREAVLAETRKHLIDMKLDQFISATNERGGIRLEVPNSILFEVGSSELEGRGRSVLGALVPLLAKGTFTVSVEGHTDNVPITTAQFPSNWELSAFRAAQVVRLLIDGGIAPDRLEAVGYADTRPLTANTSEGGRTENRRVTILLRM